ncbi:MAG: DUF4976 domain-containing protein [bacterium]|nr:DUF4976 domain-containing protein [bacterium]
MLVRVAVLAFARVRRQLQRRDQRYIKDYLRCVAALDDSLGEVLAYLDRTGLADDTVVIYTSDQGFFLGEHGWYDERWMYEPSLRTPLIVRWPGVKRPGSTADELVQNIDMAPTFLDLAGVADRPAMHGASLVPLLRGEHPEQWRDAVNYPYHQQDSSRASHTAARHCGIRTARHKSMHVYDHDVWELYDLEEDPDEMRNLGGAEEHAELQARLERRLHALREEYADAAPVK